MEQWMINGIIFFILFLSFDIFVIYRWIKVRKDILEIEDAERKLQEPSLESPDTSHRDMTGGK